MPPLPKFKHNISAIHTFVKRPNVRGMPKAQGFHENKFKVLLSQSYIKKLNRDTNAFIFRALGNAVNADVIEK